MLHDAVSEIALFDFLGSHRSQFRSRSLGGRCFYLRCLQFNLISLAGVVDAQLKLYDTANVRVVDGSVVPLQISAHLSSTFYGIAEKAADLIKASV